MNWKLEYLPKLLLQHDSSAYLENLDIGEALKEYSLQACVNPQGYVVALNFKIQSLIQTPVVVDFLQDAHSDSPRPTNSRDQCFNRHLFHLYPLRPPNIPHPRPIICNYCHSVDILLRGPQLHLHHPWNFRRLYSNPLPIFWDAFAQTGVSSIGFSCLSAR